VHVADLGHADGIDCTLVRCATCMRSWLHLWTPHASRAGYAALDDAAARELAAIPAGPDRKRKLRELLDLQEEG
jgi:hypothetical protein